VDSIQPAKIDITIDAHQAEAGLAAIRLMTSPSNAPSGQ